MDRDSAHPYLNRRKQLRESVGRGSILLYQGGEYFNENLYYLTGVDAFYTFALISLDSSDEVLVTNPFQFHEIKEKCDIAEILAVPSDEVGRVLIKSVSDRKITHLFTDYTCQSRLPLPAEWIDLLRNYVPGIKIETVPAELLRMRMIKDPEEIATVKKGIRVIEDIFSSLPAIIRPGIAESEIASVIHSNLIRDGFNKIYDVYVASGANSSEVFYRKNSGVLGENSLVLIDICASFDYYVCDIARTFPTSGRFNNLHEVLFACVKSVHDDLIKAISNTRSLGSLSEAAEEAFRVHKLEQYYLGKVGHFVGLSPDDPGDKDSILERGMVFTVEPGLYLPEERIGIRIEDTVVLN